MPPVFTTIILTTKLIEIRLFKSEKSVYYIHNYNEATTLLKGLLYKFLS